MGRDNKKYLLYKHNIEDQDNEDILLVGALELHPNIMMCVMGFTQNPTTELESYTEEEQVLDIGSYNYPGSEGSRRFVAFAGVYHWAPSLWLRHCVT